MKKIILVLLVSAISVFLHAQLAHTKWKGVIKEDNPRDAIFAFGKDTLVLSATDGSVIETMVYAVKDNILTVRKIAEQSDCDGTSAGKYKFPIKEGAMAIDLSLDACDDRSSALDKTKWNKVKH